MLVMVKYLDGTYDMVVSHRLDGLIKAGRVLEFRRGYGWARVGKDPVRESERDFRGDERRKVEAVGQMMM
jgi:hypothetical protein